MARACALVMNAGVLPGSLGPTAVLGAGSGSFQGRRRNLSWLPVSCAREFNISSSSRLLPSAAGGGEYSLPTAAHPVQQVWGAFSSGVNSGVCEAVSLGEDWCRLSL